MSGSTSLQDGGFVVTIDGPAGSGKSSTATEVARRLGFRHLDSGAVYRAMALALIRAGIPEEEWKGKGMQHLKGIRVELVPAPGRFRVLLDGKDPGEALRSPAVNARVSRLAARPAVRDLVLNPLRAAASDGGVVADGRDMGTVVFPDADLKVYLVASLRERARRRLLQEEREPTADAVDRMARELEERDERDRSRDVAPLRRPEGAMEVDTTTLTFPQQVQKIVDAVTALAGNAETP